LIDIDAYIKIIHIHFLHIKLLRLSPKYRFLTYLLKYLIITNKCYKTIKISNLFLVFKYVKHDRLCQMLRNIFQSNLRIKIMNKDSNFKNKMIVPISIKNIIFKINITSIHKSFNRLLWILKGRLSHSYFPLQALKARKEYLGCFSLTDASFRVFYL